MFEYKKPRAGYFINKIKEVEFRFRAEYLYKCEGKKPKPKSNLEKNPLENLTLPHKTILDLCTKSIEENNHNLPQLKTNKEFIENIETMVTKYIQSIDFSHLQTQAETERKQNQILNNSEESKSANDGVEKAEEKEEKEEEEEEEIEEEDDDDDDEEEGKKEQEKGEEKKDLIADEDVEENDQYLLDVVDEVENLSYNLGKISIGIFIYTFNLFFAGKTKSQTQLTKYFYLKKVKKNEPSTSSPL